MDRLLGNSGKRGKLFTNHTKKKVINFISSQRNANLVVFTYQILEGFRNKHHPLLVKVCGKDPLVIAAWEHNLGCPLRRAG